MVRKVICNKAKECTFDVVCTHKKPHAPIWGCDKIVECAQTGLLAACVPCVEITTQTTESKANDLHRRYNYDLCEAIDLLKLGSVLAKMVKSGHMHEKIAKLYRDQAQGLLTLLREENNSAFDK